MDLNLHTLYLICATVGGSVLVIQFILMLIGFGDEGDMDASEFELDEEGVGGNLFFGFLSVKTVVAFLTFFGLVGWLIDLSDWNLSPGTGVLLATAAGALAFYLVGFIMASLYRLDATGNVNIKKAIGKTAKVYLKIPGQNSGAGKVTVKFDAGTLELAAVTEGEEILTGSLVRIVGISGESILNVTPVS